MIPVRFLSPAEFDLKEGYEWYESQQHGLGKAFIEEIRTVCQHLTIDPTSHPVVRKSIRRHPVDRFPFDVLFVVEADEIMIVAIAHHHRHPQTWWRRLHPRNPS